MYLPFFHLSTTHFCSFCLITLMTFKLIGYKEEGHLFKWRTITYSLIICYILNCFLYISTPKAKERKYLAWIKLFVWKIIVLFLSKASRQLYYLSFLFYIWKLFSKSTNNMKTVKHTEIHHCLLNISSQFFSDCTVAT